MSNKIQVGGENIYERLWKLYMMVGKMVQDGTRDPKKVAEILQTIVDGAGMKIYLKRLFADEVITFGGVEVVIYELVKGANLQQVLGDIGGKRRCWEDKEGALSFAEQNKDRLGLNGNFFELEGGFVADVFFVGGGQLEFSMYGLSCGGLWLAGQHRVVSLQQ